MGEVQISLKSPLFILPYLLSTNIMATRSRTRRRRISYILRSGCQDQRTCILESIELSGSGSHGRPSRSPTPRNQLSLPANVGYAYPPQQQQLTGPANISVDSAYFTSPEGTVSPAPPPTPLPPHAVCPTKTRASTWISSLRNLLHLSRQKGDSHPPVTSEYPSPPPAAATLPESLVGCTATVPESEEELDQFLFEVWTKDTVANPRSTTSPVSQYVRKVSELRLFYEQKMAEVAQREATYLSELMYYDETTPLLQSEQLSLADSLQLKQVLLETKVNYKFDEMRYKLKKEAAETVAQLRSHYIAENGRKKRKLPQKSTKLLSEWYEQHLDYPYPTEEEKQQLSTRCDMTVKQVSRWFANKRSRSKSSLRDVPRSGGHSNTL